MKLGDLIDENVFKDLSVKKDLILSIKELLRKHNLSYSKFNSRVSHLDLNLPTNINKDLPIDLFNKINSFLENSKSNYKTINNRLFEENTETIPKFITIKFGEHKGRKLRYVEDHFPSYIENCKTKGFHWILEGKVCNPNTEINNKDVNVKGSANKIILANVTDEKVIENNESEEKSNLYLGRDEIKQIQEHFSRTPFSAFDLFKKLIKLKKHKIKNSELRSHFEVIINKKLS